ncbi:phytoene desaturase family protein [Corynebacterium uterequi]|uniref:Phytoene desaturase n=1 Tax=Corynebacterium uterequi TaxID=1072256 RepID=A0A0G3H9K4_9CORY|nr:phytoene desaturase family protein [Corynebacterium uterequi]AKK10051.1 phytoene desaturase [Corynebacterium uterequi]
MTKHAVVIGAGVAGLATAGLLARRGYRVTVVEKNPEPGGRAGELSVDGFRFETGPSWYLMPEAFDHFFELMGTSTAAELDLQLLDPGYRVYPQGEEPVDVPYGLDAACALFESLEPGAGDALRDYLASADEVYQLALRRFLYTTFASPAPFANAEVISRARQFARLLTESLDSFVNRRFADNRLRQILQYPAVFLSSRPERAPSMYHLMSHTDLTLGVHYPQGGFTSIVTALHRLAVEHGVSIELGVEVTAITVDGSRATGVRVLRDGEIAEIPADVVVSAADLHHTETSLLPKHLRSYPESYFARRDPGLGTVLALLGVDGELPQLRHHTLLFSREWEADFDVVYDGPHPSRPTGASQSLYVCKPSATDDTVAPAGCENLFVLIPVAADESLGHGDAYHPQASAAVTAIVDAAVEQISQWAGIPDLTERIVVKRSLGPADFAERYHAWSGGAIGPAHTLRQSAFLRGRNASKKVRGLYYAGGTTVPGVGVPMCLISAENILKRLDGDGSAGPLGSVHG